MPADRQSRRLTFPILCLLPRDRGRETRAGSRAVSDEPLQFTRGGAGGTR